MEEAGGAEERVAPASKKITIEQVLPETSTPEWPGPSADGGKEVESPHRRPVHTLSVVTRVIGRHIEEGGG